MLELVEYSGHLFVSIKYTVSESHICVYTSERYCKTRCGKQELLQCKQQQNQLTLLKSGVKKFTH